MSSLVRAKAPWWGRQGATSIIQEQNIAFQCDLNGLPGGKLAWVDARENAKLEVCKSVKRKKKEE